MEVFSQLLAFKIPSQVRVSAIILIVKGKTVYTINIVVGILKFVHHPFFRKWKQVLGLSIFWFIDQNCRLTT